MLTLFGAVRSHDAFHGSDDLLCDWRRHGGGVDSTVGVGTQVVHQLLREKTRQVSV